MVAEIQWLVKGGYQSSCLGVKLVGRSRRLANKLAERDDLDVDRRKAWDRRRVRGRGHGGRRVRGSSHDG